VAFGYFYGYQAVYHGACLVTAWAIGARPYEAALGFGPVIASLRVRGCRCSLRLFPGGFIRLEPGPSEGDAPARGARDFSRLLAAQKIRILSAGPLACLALGAAVLMLSWIRGRTEPVFLLEPARIGSCRVGSPLQKAGLMPGDEIVALRHDSVVVPVGSWRVLVRALGWIRNRTVIIECRRGGSAVSLTAQLGDSGLLDVAPAAPPGGEHVAAGSPTEEVGVLPLPYASHAVRRDVRQACREALSEALDSVHAAPLWLIAKNSTFPDAGLRDLAIFLHSAKGSRTLVALGLIGLYMGILNLLPIPPLNGGNIAIFCVEFLFGRDLGVRTKEFLSGVGAVLVLVAMVWLLFRIAGRVFGF
jgi:regulator of sigma E protease